MSFIEIVQRAEQLLRQRGRISLRVLKREFDLDDEAFDELVEELVDIQQVAAREGKALAWIGSAARGPEPSTATTAQAVAPDRELPSEAERRQLTVLFCDLVDSTRLAAGMDPEDWREVVRGYQEATAEVVESFSGHVAQYLGDGLLVYFGWPRAHEDDAERAVRAGLGILSTVEDLRAAASFELAVRVGIHTGPVVVGEMGGGASRETLAMGDTTNVAARLQTLAEAGAVLLSAATLRLVQGVFVTEDLGTHEFRGVGDVHAFRALRPSGMRSRLDLASAGALTPLVGREQELGLLEDRFAQIREGWGQAVLIAGEAGIGKSRLVQAFRERLAERGHTWLECRASPYTQDSALYPVLELLRQALGFRADESVEAKLARLEGGLANAGFEGAEVLASMARFLGLPFSGDSAEFALSPEGQRKQALALLVEWLLRLGRFQPAVLLMEDLHWMDPSTLELIGAILEQIPQAQVLLLATHRADFHPPWGARSHLTPILLSRMTRAQLVDLVRKVMPGRALPEAWVDEIVRRSDGVPLFAEELTKTVAESHPNPPSEGEAPALQIPETLQDSLMARLDSLGPAKELAQLGSVLGREFSYDVLLAVSPLKESELQLMLETAVREELFYRRGVHPETTYLFKHALLRDAAYQSLLRRTRQAHHRRVAEVLTGRMPEVAESQPELVAHHLGEAGEADRALEWWIRAAERANARAGYAESGAYVRRGLELVPALHDSGRRRQRELRLHVLLGSALTASRGWAHPETERAWERAAALCDAERDPRGSCLIEWYLATSCLVGGAYARSLELHRKVRRIGIECGDRWLEVAGCFSSGLALLYLGNLTESRGLLEAAIELSRTPAPAPTEVELPEQPQLQAWALLSWNLALSGFPDRARAVAREGIERARDAGQPYIVAYLLGIGAAGAIMRRDWEETCRLGGDAARVAREQGLDLFEAVGEMASATGSFMRARKPAEIDRFRAAVGQASQGNRAAAGLILGHLAEMLLLAGRPQEAAEQLAGVLALVSATKESFCLAELHRLEGELALALGRKPEEAEERFREAIDVARSQEAKLLELRAATSLARLWQSRGKRTEARDVLQPVYDWFTEGFDTQDLKDAKALLEELSA